MIAFTPVLKGAAIGAGIETPEDVSAEFVTADYPRWALLATKWQGQAVTQEALRAEVLRIGALSEEAALSELADGAS